MGKFLGTLSDMSPFVPSERKMSQASGCLEAQYGRQCVLLTLVYVPLSVCPSGCPERMSLPTPPSRLTCLPWSGLVGVPWDKPDAVAAVYGTMPPGAAWHPGGARVTPTGHLPLTADV